MLLFVSFFVPSFFFFFLFFFDVRSTNIRCDAKSSCHIYANSSTFGTPCLNSVHILEVFHTCVNKSSFHSSLIFSLFFLTNQSYLLIKHKHANAFLFTISMTYLFLYSHVQSTRQLGNSACVHRRRNDTTLLLVNVLSVDHSGHTTTREQAQVPTASQRRRAVHRCRRADHQRAVLVAAEKQPRRRQHVQVPRHRRVHSRQLLVFDFTTDDHRRYHKTNHNKNNNNNTGEFIAVILVNASAAATLHRRIDVRCHIERYSL